MKAGFWKICFLILLIIAGEFAWNKGLVFSQSVPSTSSTSDQLQQQIQIKSQQLQDINNQLNATQQNLQETQNERATLQKQLNTIQNNIQQLNLGIKSDQVTNQELGLEVQSLNYDLADIESSIKDKSDAIGEIIREFQRSDQDTLLILFLRDGTLANSVLDAQALVDLRSQLSSDIQNLANLHQSYLGKIQQINGKMSEINLHQENLKARTAIISDEKVTQEVILSQTKDKESAYQQQFAELRKQQDDVAVEISDLEAQLQASFNVSVLPQAIHGLLAWPIQGKVIVTQAYGTHSYLYGGKPHNGLDLGAPVGTPIFAADSGTVIAVDNNDVGVWRRYQYGKYILIKHNDNLATLYGHLARQIVQVGDVVERGQLIGYSDTTGYATGPHLHLGLYWAPSIVMKSIPLAAGLVPIGVTIDPEIYLPPLP